MKRLLVSALLSAAFLVGAPTKASAGSIIFILDCTVTNVGCTPGGFFGTVTLTDNIGNANLVDVSIDLVNPLLTQTLSLNWVGALPSGFYATGGNIAGADFKYLTDFEGAFQRFDISISDTSALSDPLTFSIARSSTGSAAGTQFNLDVSMFLAKDELNGLWAAVRVGTTAVTGTDSRNCNTTCYGATTAVPEPATLGMLGLGLFAVALKLRARRA